MDPYTRLLLPENLIYAWRKARRIYRFTAGHVDIGEINEFELDLENRLRRIQDRFVAQTYQTRKLRPLPQPKKIEHNQPIDRQYYHVAVDDQVAWIAVANVLGPVLDPIMPPWSYGNRLYRAAWYEPPVPSGRRPSKLEIGPYRHQAGHLYRRFQNSWPLFRRHVALTARHMVRSEPIAPDELEPADHRAILSANRDDLSYVRSSYWNHRSNPSGHQSLYYSSFDLKEFFPRIERSAVIEVIKARLDIHSDDPLIKIINGLMHFRIDHSGVPSYLTRRVIPPYPKQRIHGLPTGLFVAGFLSNLAMLPVDDEVNLMLNEKRVIAHFRFVDDHSVLAYQFEDLCEWITTYAELLKKHAVGPTINEDKFVPESFGKLILGSHPEFGRTKTALRNAARRETLIDGSNPNSLLTPTLTQVSAIAAAHPNTMDDDDLRDLLTRLEWLLLVDLPDGELRADTRMAFAAGRIATTAPFLTPISLEMTLASRLGIAEESDSAAEMVQGERVQRQEEGRHYGYYFSRLIQAFREYPANIRLFQRVHFYCLVTGYSGLSSIADWLVTIMNSGWDTWAHYYCSLSLHTLTHNVVTCLRHFGDPNGLRSDRDASLRHLVDIGNLPFRELLAHGSGGSWYHSNARVSLGVALRSALVGPPAAILPQTTVARLRSAADLCLQPTVSAVSRDLLPDTPWDAGVWAHFIESRVSRNANDPSSIWYWFQSSFRRENTYDRLALRRYPQHLPNRAWEELVLNPKSLKFSDTGWVREAMRDDPVRIQAGRSSRNRVLKKAAQSYTTAAKRYLTLLQWTRFTLDECSVFDPRRSEWTALEIVAQIVTILFRKDAKSVVHPVNVFIPRSWSDHLRTTGVESFTSWNDWRSQARRQRVILRSQSTSISDYRYYPDDIPGLTPWDRRLISLGRLLLGILSCDHRSPPLWNLRGNERSVPFPRGSIYSSLAISTPTVILAEACLNPRVAETRTIFRAPVLFGIDHDVRPNDTLFEAPTLNTVDDLKRCIAHAQTVLEAHQLSIAQRRPRQLIPFRLSGSPLDETQDGE